MEDQNIKSSKHYFRIKTEWTAEDESGNLSKVKTEELVLATCFTEAEKVAYAIAEDQNRGKYGDFNIDIVKTKISDVLYNDILAHDSKLICGMVCNYFEEDETSGFGLYAVKAVYIETDEKTGKEKKTTDTIYVPAISNADATDAVQQYLSTGAIDFVIRDTKFDKAEAIYWPSEVQKEKLRCFNNK